MKRTRNYTDDVQGLIYPLHILEQEDLHDLETLVASLHPTSFRTLTYSTCKFSPITNGHMTIRDDYTGDEWLISYAFEDMENGYGTLIAWSEEETSCWDGLGLGVRPSEICWRAQYKALVEYLYRHCQAEMDQCQEADTEEARDIHQDRAWLLEQAYNFAAARMVDHYDLPPINCRPLQD